MTYCHIAIAPYNGLEALRGKGLAHPGKPDIICSITLEMADAIQGIAERRKVGETTMGRTLWMCGCSVLVAKSLGDRLPEELRSLIDGIPVQENTPGGGHQLRINVLDEDLEQLRGVAKAQRKKTAQLHRDALAIGIWVYERIGDVWELASCQ